MKALRSTGGMRLLQIAAIASALMLMLAIAQNASAQEASAQGMPLSSMLSPDVLPIDPSRQMDTGLTVIRNADGSIGLAEAPDEAKRPLKLAFYDEFQPSDSRAFRSFISNNMMPAAASLLGRFIRVLHSLAQCIHGTRPCLARANIGVVSFVTTLLSCSQWQVYALVRELTVYALVEAGLFE